ncbi:hypothetical protein HKCCE4037_19060 [Rhodobacterales bacterium HKCCE4037]|nr:hypothetical protein [Rhodobacterales bacterium HKCCE4037]
MLLPTPVPAGDPVTVDPAEVVPLAPPQGTGTIRETMSAPPSDAEATPAPVPTPNPSPQPQPQPGAPRAPLIFDPAISEIDNDTGAGQAVPRQPVGPRVPSAPRQPSQPEAGPTTNPNVPPGATITPILPPFIGSIQRNCQYHMCFAIIAHPDGRVTIHQH